MPQKGSSGGGSGGKLIFLVIILVLVIIVLLQNRHIVGIRLFFWTIGMSQALLTLLSVLVGFVAGLITYAMTGLSKQRK
jgi:uncharacterized integral membrane protein